MRCSYCGGSCRWNGMIWICMACMQAKYGAAAPVEEEVAAPAPAPVVEEEAAPAPGARTRKTPHRPLY